MVIYRGGDAISGSVFALLSDGLGLGLAALSLVGAAIAAVWTAVALRLGRRYDADRTHSLIDPNRALPAARVQLPAS